MADPEPTRSETVEANITAVKTKFGEDNWVKLLAVCLEDISTSLAMLVDAGSSSSDNSGSGNDVIAQ